MSGPSWLIDSKRIASKIKNASAPVDHSRHAWKSNPTKECPKCKHIIDNDDFGHEWPGLPKGVKFDPSDQELLWHLLTKLGKVGVEPHPFIDEFISTVEADEGICYTHPQKLPGVKQDGSVSFKAYNTGTKKRRKINTGELGEVRWHKTGKTKPVIIDGKHLGCKKIMVLYVSTVKSGKREKTNWVMHQYHLGTGEDEKDGDFVISKLFYQQHPKPDENMQIMTTVDALEPTSVELDLFDCLPLMELSALPREEDNSNKETVQNSEHNSDQVASINNCNEIVLFIRYRDKKTVLVNGYCEMKDRSDVHPSSEKGEDQDNHPSQDPKWWEGESQFLLNSQQLAECMSICDEFLQSQNSCGGGDEPNKSRPCLADYTQLTADELKKDLEECQKLDDLDNTDLELDCTPEFRLSQLEFSLDSLPTAWSDGTSKT